MTTIPATMKSIIIKENGDVDKLIYEEVPTPKVSEGSVLVKNHVAGKRGLYKVPLPYTPGTEGAGEVVEVGPDVKDVKPTLSSCPTQYLLKKPLLQAFRP
ncbi:hypothetical protein G6F36_013056 [Rhizopus arrhizus]|nr:hypothetical protein G6F36_013056 [Rhizopus arrhizus]